MAEVLENNKRIAKNAVFLYIRMFLTLLIGLYTSRIILKALGIEDYGIYNVVGGVVTLLGFVNMSLSNASSRFITIALGQGNQDELKNTFNSVVTIHFIFAAVLFIIAETIGLWFVENKLVIPQSREWAAFWVYQSAVLTTIIMIVSIPFNALIIAHEKMNAFAYVSIFETVAKLLVALSLYFIPFDRLIVYAILLVIVQICVRLSYTIYCNIYFIESKYKITWDKKKVKKIFVFAGWTLNGNLAVMGYTQGLNILLNMFFGPAVNAARGIAVQVQSAMKHFFYNFQMAVNPQIIKSYAANNLAYMHDLVMYCSRYSFFVMLIIALPVLFNTSYILRLWLGDVPEYTSSFVQIMIGVAMINTLSTPLMTSIHATGNIKWFQIIEGTILLSVIPISYILMKSWRISPEKVLLVYFFVEFVTQIVRVFLVCPKISLSMKSYFKYVCVPILKVSFIACVLPFIINFFKVDTLSYFLIMSAICIISACVTIYCGGMNTRERNFVVTRFLKLLKRKNK